MKDNLPIGIIIGFLCAIALLLVGGGLAYIYVKSQKEKVLTEQVQAETNVPADSIATSEQTSGGTEGVVAEATAAAISAAESNDGHLYGLIKDEGGITNIRKGRGTSYPVASQVEDGMFIMFDPPVEGWCKVYDHYTDGTPPTAIGYVRADKIVVPAKTAEDKYIAVVHDEDGYTNIRRGPGTSHPIVGRVKDGSYILYSGSPVNDAWLKVYSQGGTLRGYMSSTRLVALESPEF